MRFWRLKSLRICCWQAGDPGGGVIQFESEGLRTRAASGRKASPRAGDELSPTQEVRQEKKGG